MMTTMLGGGPASPSCAPAGGTAANAMGTAMLISAR